MINFPPYRNNSFILFKIIESLGHHFFVNKFFILHILMNELAFKTLSVKVYAFCLCII